MHNLSSRLAIKGHGDRSRYALLKRYGVKTKFISASDPTLGAKFPAAETAVKTHMWRKKPLWATFKRRSGPRR